MNDIEITDKRVVNTMNNIKNGMISLLEKKEFEKITIKDICTESGISRTTFYAHYKDKNNFIYSYLKSLLKKGKKEIFKKEFSNQHIFLETMVHYWLDEGKLILLLLGDDSAQKAHIQMKKILQYNVELNLVPILNTKSLTTKEKYFLLIFMSNAIFGVLQDWVKRGCVETPKELATIMNKIFENAFK
ncbi:TetR/AcrR family transcriptional regulator [Staphylococcus petrasii]|uniref:TetR/AcrR family transcriptional regulator n=3 Tax=Staphylococcus petrasii TaxID=1276936 RepID=UPI000E03C316|nr:TetR/AcrR family transcriptional regulator C-terminal domain-containing protein [Staphylococcus petrasii]TGA81747.1 TetR/AcrR family transcriptional regulator [Staphylococcus petrasii]SUM59242.1 transcriptional regulator TetR-family [Staphylococcus petrasii]